MCVQYNSLSDKLKNHNFTSSGDLEKEYFVRDLVRKSVNKITSVSSPIAIYLQGSFGRGEGNILTNDDGEHQLWRDLDFVIVYRFKESAKKVSCLQNELNQLEGVNKTGNPANSSYISLAQLPQPIAIRWRDLKMHELATNSLHLYGEDIRPKMAVQDGEIPLESGERFLLQKCMGLCKAYPFLTKNQFTSNYEVSKTYIEISNALCLKEGYPNANFYDRLDILKNSNHDEIRELVPIIKKWGKYKINGDIDVLENISGQKAWQNAVEDLISTIRIYNDMEIKTEEMMDSPNQWIDEYYNSLSGRFLANTFRSSVASSWPPNIFIQLLGTIGSLLYRCYGSIVLSERRNELISCPLSSTYVASIACLLCLYNERDKEWENKFYELLNYSGSNIDSTNVNDWITELDNAYLRAAEPLYGLG